MGYTYHDRTPSPKMRRTHTGGSLPRRRCPPCRHVLATANDFPVSICPTPWGRVRGERVRVVCAPPRSSQIMRQILVAHKHTSTLNRLRSYVSSTLSNIRGPARQFSEEFAEDLAELVPVPCPGASKIPQLRRPWAAWRRRPGKNLDPFSFGC